MSAPLILIVTVIYLGVAISEFLKGGYPMSLIFTAYATANLGFVWLTK